MNRVISSSARALPTSCPKASKLFIKPHVRTRRMARVAPPRTSALLELPLIAGNNVWGTWAALTFAGWAGLYSENFRLGKELSGALVSTLVGLALSNLGVISTSSIQYDVVNKYLLPLAVPLLLFGADLRKVVSDTGRLLAAFMIGTVGTVLGTVIGFHLLPLASLGADSWKIAAALCARHIGGAVNYVSVSDALEMSGEALTAGLAADNLICAIYFTTLYALARDIPAEAKAAPAAGGAVAGAAAAAPGGGESRGTVDVRQGSTALMVSAAICYLSDIIAKAMGAPSLHICVATAITVALATFFPKQLKPMVGSAEGISAILLQFFFAAIGAAGSVAQVVSKAPALFAFSFLQIAIHLGFIFLVGKLLRVDKKDLIIGSNANVGGPTTAAGMCVAKGWRSSVVPSVLVGTFGYSIATFLSVALGQGLLRGMAVGLVA